MGKTLYDLCCEGDMVFTTTDKRELVTYLWGRILRKHPDAPYRYTVRCHVPFVVDTGDLDTFVARLPE